MIQETHDALKLDG